MLLLEEKANHNTEKFPSTLPQISEPVGDQKNEIGWDWVMLHRLGTVHTDSRRVIMGKLGAREKTV